MKSSNTHTHYMKPVHMVYMYMYYYCIYKAKNDCIKFTLITHAVPYRCFFVKIKMKIKSNFNGHYSKNLHTKYLVFDIQGFIQG